MQADAEGRLSGAGAELLLAAGRDAQFFLIGAADPQRWTVFDLRPLRPRIPRLGTLPEQTLQVLYGFDAVVILSGSGPQHDLLQ